jgi:hypothetical protein
MGGVESMTKSFFGGSESFALSSKTTRPGWWLAAGLINDDADFIGGDDADGEDGLLRNALGEGRKHVNAPFFDDAHLVRVWAESAKLIQTRRFAYRSEYQRRTLSQRRDWV